MKEKCIVCGWYMQHYRDNDLTPYCPNMDCTQYGKPVRRGGLQ